MEMNILPKYTVGPNHKYVSDSQPENPIISCKEKEPSKDIDIRQLGWSKFSAWKSIFYTK